MHLFAVRIFAVIVLCSAAAHNLRAERLDASRTDTLDWRRYFPLQVGNVWEYDVTEPPSTLRREIVDDISYQGRHYFVLRESWGGATITDPSIRYLRYDSAGVVVFVDELEEDSIDVPIPLPIVAGEHDFLEYFDLRSAIGDTLHYDSAQNEYYVVTGESHKQVIIGRDSVDVEKDKCLHRSWWFECYASDIGFLRGGSLEFYRLSYARIGSRTYGAQDFTSAVQGSSEKLDDAIDVFPNPATSEVDVAFSMHAAGTVTLRVVSMTGRVVSDAKLGFYTTGRHYSSIDISTLPAAVYIVQLQTNGGPVSASFFALVR